MRVERRNTWMDWMAIVVFGLPLLGLASVATYGFIVSGPWPWWVDVPVLMWAGVASLAICGAFDGV